MLDYLLQLKFSNEVWLYVIPCVLMVIDILTGYYAAWERKEISSKKMRDGIGKKIAELFYILIGVLFSFAFSIKFVAYFVSIYISYMELVSVNENFKKLGLNVEQTTKEEVKKELDKSASKVPIKVEEDNKTSKK